MSTKLERVAERARREPDGRFHTLAHLIDEEALKRSFEKIRKQAAVGVDGIRKEDYGANLSDNLRNLHERLRTKRYRHQPVRRVQIRKEDGRLRPLGLSCVEDKIVQGALSEVLGAVYEQDFRDCSFGFRPKRSAHDALRTLDQKVQECNVGWILEADVVSFFDNVDRSALKEMLEIRVPDKSIKRLVGKCLNAGTLAGEEFLHPERGTTQGSRMSPLLGNIYLHYVLDVWFEDVVRPQLKGRACLIRYADDFVLGFSQKEDAQQVLRALEERFRAFGLELHPEKTRLVPFRRPPRRQNSGKGPGSFDLLGFTLYWRRSRKGRWHLAFKTRSARLRRITKVLHEWCRRHRHDSVKDQHAALVRRIRGHFNYYGVNGNQDSLAVVRYRAERCWLKWLRRRSQRSRLTWERFSALLKTYPLPRPRVYAPIWGSRTSVSPG